MTVELKCDFKGCGLIVTVKDRNFPTEWEYLGEEDLCLTHRQLLREFKERQKKRDGLEQSAFIKGFISEPDTI